MQIDLGLAAARHAVQQERREALRGADRVERLGLLVRERRRHSSSTGCQQVIHSFGHRRIGPADLSTSTQPRAAQSSSVAPPSGAARAPRQRQRAAVDQRLREPTQRAARGQCIGQRAARFRRPVTHLGREQPPPAPGIAQPAAAPAARPRHARAGSNPRRTTRARASPATTAAGRCRSRRSRAAATAARRCESSLRRRLDGLPLAERHLHERAWAPVARRSGSRTGWRADGRARRADRCRSSRRSGGGMRRMGMDGRHPRPPRGSELKVKLQFRR